MHTEVEKYCKSVKKRYPWCFKDKKVLDVGSQDINWNNRYLFTWWTYYWIDLWEWKNVDEVYDITKWPFWMFDVVVTTEMLEHCREYYKALENMLDSLNKWWMLLLTAAWRNRKEHWTTRTSPADSPYTNDWYMNIELKDLEFMCKYFEESEIIESWLDIYFCWINKIW